MKESKKAITTIGESLGMKRVIELLLSNVGLHSTIKELTYQMFVQNKQQYFESISLIREYYQKMAK